MGDEDSNPPKQIVRPLGKNEFAPAYSTIELLNGVCHIARIPGERLNKGISAGLRQSVIDRQKEAQAGYIEFRPKLKEMLIENASNLKIARALNCSEGKVQRMISESSELRALAAGKRRKKTPEDMKDANRKK